MPTIFPNRHMVIVNKAQKDQFKSLSDLAGKKAATTRNPWQHTFLDKQNQTVYKDKLAELDFYADFTQMLAAVDSGKADFALLSAEDALWFIRHQLKNSVAAFPNGDLKETGWGFRKDNQDLQAAFQQFWQAQVADKDSLLNAVWKETFGMSFASYTRLVTAIK